MKVSNYLYDILKTVTNCGLVSPDRINGGNYGETAKINGGGQVKEKESRSKESGFLYAKAGQIGYAKEIITARERNIWSEDNSLAANSDQTSHMVIVFAFGLGVKSYAEEFAAGCLYRVEKCPTCQTAGCLVRHGVYWRKPRDGERVYCLPIQRWLCKGCQHTCSVLPDFLLCFRWYLLAVVNAVLVARAEQDTSWHALGEAAAGAPHIRTMQRWWAAFGMRAGEWLGFIQTFLAEQDSPSAWLDPHGEAPRGRDSRQALLGAAGYLLAWAKGRWRELAAYGWKDRLDFLWLWGSGQGLGRFV